MKVFFIFLLTILFICLGLVIYLYFQVQSKVPTSALLNSWPVTSEPVSLTLNLSSPEDNMLVFDTDLLLQGKTSPQAVVVLSLNDTDEAIEASSQGSFSTTLKLEEGINQVSVTVFDSLGNSKSIDRTIYYSEEKL